MRFYDKLNAIIGDVLESKSKPFAPDRNFFASIPNSEAWAQGFSSLVQSMLQRFPLQPKMPGFHPALRYNFQALRLNRGVLFISKMLRIEAKFFQINKEAARFKDQEYRKLARATQLLLINEVTAQRSLDAMERFYFKLFDDKAIKRARDSEKYLRAWTEKADEAIALLTEKYKEVDISKEAVKDKYWKDYDKNREIKPRTVSVGGASLQQILNELPWIEGSALWRMYSMIQENRLNLYSEQIAESYDGALPPELISKGAFFNRRLWELFSRNLKKDQTHKLHLDYSENYVDDRNVRDKIRYDFFAESQTLRKNEFREVWEKNNEILPVRLNISTTNVQEVLSQHNTASASLINAFQEKTKDTQLIARADMYIDSMSSAIPSEVLFNFGIYHPHRKQRKPFDPQVRQELEKRSDHSEKLVDLMRKRDSHQVASRDHMIDRKNQELNAKEDILQAQDQDKTIRYREEAKKTQASIEDRILNEQSPRINPNLTSEKRKIG